MYVHNYIRLASDIVVSIYYTIENEMFANFLWATIKGEQKDSSEAQKRIRPRRYEHDQRV